MYGIIRNRNLTVDFCSQMTTHDVRKMSQIGVNFHMPKLTWITALYSPLSFQTLILVYQSGQLIFCSIWYTKNFKI